MSTTKANIYLSFSLLRLLNKTRSFIYNGPLMIFFFCRWPYSISVMNCPYLYQYATSQACKVIYHHTYHHRCICSYISMSNFMLLLCIAIVISSLNMPLILRKIHNQDLIVYSVQIFIYTICIETELKNVLWYLSKHIVMMAMMIIVVVDVVPRFREMAVVIDERQHYTEKTKQTLHKM